MPLVECGEIHILCAFWGWRAGYLFGISALAIPFEKPFFGRDERGENRIFIIEVEVCLPHQVVGNALLSVVGMGANAADVGRLHLLPMIQQVVRQGLKSRHHAIVYLANDVVFGSEHAREV